MAGSGGWSRAVVLAFADRGAIAMGGLFVPDASADAFVWGMVGRAGVPRPRPGLRILERLLEHADEHGRSVLLHVTEGNDTARSLYERHGFTATGEMQPLREGSHVRIVTMRRC
jgi:GNAT superfamily N-acetyltransferase